MSRVGNNSPRAGENEWAERDLWVPSLHPEHSPERPASVKPTARRPRVRPMHILDDSDALRMPGEEGRNKTAISLQGPS